MFKKTILILAVMAAMCCNLTAAQSSPSSKVRIGTYNSRCVALAYGRSNEALEQIAAICKTAQKAKDSNDTEQYTKLKKDMEIRQQKMHLQVFSSARIDEIIEKIQPKLANIAKQADVVMIIEEPAYTASGADVEFVDVTMQLAQEFEPDEKTLIMIKELPGHKPLSFEKAMQLMAEDKL